MSPQIIIMAIGVVVAMIALGSWFNTLKNQRADKCLEALYDVVGLANRCLTLKLKNHPSERIWPAYDEAWNGHRKFAAAWAIMRRYYPKFDAEMPRRVSQLLLQTEDILARVGPVTQSECDGITNELENVRGTVEGRLPPPSFWRTLWWRVCGVFGH